MSIAVDDASCPSILFDQRVPWNRFLVPHKRMRNKFYLDAYAVTSCTKLISLFRDVFLRDDAPPISSQSAAFISRSSRRAAVFLSAIINSFNRPLSGRVICELKLHGTAWYATLRTFLRKLCNQLVPEMRWLRREIPILRKFFDALIEPIGSILF